jgi:hypothetical protein
MSATPMRTRPLFPPDRPSLARLPLGWPTRALPRGAKEDSVGAGYDRGIPEIRVGVGGPAAEGRKVPVLPGNGARS